jgi:L-aminopeptidase/D-esterase-like protein
MSDSDSELTRRRMLAGAGVTGLTLLGLQPGMAGGEDPPARKPDDPVPPGRQPKARARDLGVTLDGTPGPGNAITDVKGVEVGHVTLIDGDGRLVVGKGPVRTGVTAILPRGKKYDPVFAGLFALNGNGEMTGSHWIEESGFLETPVLITNTHSVGVVRDAAVAWARDHQFYEPHFKDLWFTLPVVAETYDGFLNDINGFHVKPEHAAAALNGANPGPVAEGNVGGGTGMICHGFKGGIGTASRKTRAGHTVGVLLQANHGSRPRLTVAGVPVGREIADLLPERKGPDAGGRDGSIIVVVATDAPLLPHQLKRVARRVSLGVGLVGGLGENGSGDIFLAFSTANPGAARRGGVKDLTMLSNDDVNLVFEATVQATEEAILNALAAAETMTGINGNTVHALPHGRLREILKKYNRLATRE